MKDRWSPAITRRAVVQRSAVLLGTLITAACGANRTSPVFSTSTAPSMPTATSLTPPRTDLDRVLVVNPSHPNTDDANPGTDDRPLRTIAKAADIAVQNNLRSVSTRVVIAPGIYREAIGLQSDMGLTDAPMLFETKQHGTATIAGSDVWSGWKKQGTTNTYSHPWPYKWGVEPYPAGWQGNVTLQPIVRRREMIFVNGHSLAQVLSSKDLKEGTFFVSEQTATVFLVPPAGTAIENATVEVAVRPNLFVVEGGRNLTVRGIVFQHANTPVGDTAVIFNNCSDVLVEDCGFLWNNYSGMTFMSTEGHSARGMTARRNIANYNGAIGLEAGRVRDLLYEDNETSYNNWRGALGQFYQWATGGMKHLFIHNGVYRRHRAVGNQAAGMWLDTDCANITIERAYCARNYIGIFIEASEGPVSVTDSTVVQSQVDGVQTEGGAGVTLAGNILYGSAGAQIRVYKGVRPVKNWETNEDYNLAAERWTVRKNIIVGSDAAPRLVRIGNSAGKNIDRFLSTLTSDENVWFSPKNGGAFTVDDKSMDFDAWRSGAKQDASSRFVDPQFVDPENDNFDLRATSPLRNK